MAEYVAEMLKANRYFRLAMIERLLNRNYSFNFSVAGWKLLLLLCACLIFPYVLWEVFWYSKVGNAAIKWHTWLAAGAAFAVLIILPFKPIIWFRNTFLVGIIYLVACVGVGEKHPFTRVPMYTSFNKEIPILSLADDSGALIPFHSYSLFTSQDVMHKYFLLRTHYRSLLDSSETEEKVYSFLNREIKKNRKQNVNGTQAHLVLNIVSITGDSIKLSSKAISTKNE